MNSIPNKGKQNNFIINEVESKQQLSKMLRMDSFINAGKKETMTDPVKSISTKKVLPQAEV